jgi:hypothetical protein
MKRIVAGVIAVCLSASPLCAQTYYFSGTVGNVPVFATLSRNGDNLIGSYLYLKYGKSIELSGEIDAKGAFHLNETSFDTTKKSGDFTGAVKQALLWSGTWRSATGAKSLPFAFQEQRDTLANVSGDFRCSEKHTDHKYGYVYTRSAQVSIRNGAVTHLDLAQESKGTDGDSQGCYIGIKDFKQVPGGGGVTLRAKSDTPDSALHCTLHVAGNADFVYVSPGDLSQTGNDCKGADDVMFCSPRADWGDFLIDKSGVCKPND